MSRSSMRRASHLVFAPWIVAAFVVPAFSAEPGAKDAKRSAPAVLVYEVDPQSKRDGQPVDMKKVLAALERRLNPGWFARARIRELAGERVEVTVLKTDPPNVERIDRLVLCAGTLEFRITANTHDHRSIIARAKLLGERETKVFGEKGPDGRATPLLAWWAPVFEKREGGFPSATFVTRKVTDRDKETTQVLVVNDAFNVTGNYLLRAAPDIDERGRPDVVLAFDAAGAALFGQLTSLNLPDEVMEFYRNLAILLDGKVYSAPRIQARVFDRAQISGDFTQEEAQAFADVLNAGPLGVRLKRVTGAEKGP